MIGGVWLLFSGLIVVEAFGCETTGVIGGVWLLLVFI